MVFLKGVQAFFSFYKLVVFYSCYEPQYGISPFPTIHMLSMDLFNDNMISTAFSSG